MKKINLFAIILSLTISCAPQNQKIEINEKAKPKKIIVSQDFAQGSEDIPLLKGMKKIFNDGVGFDSANGSIMSSAYKTEDDFELIKKFYLQNLPQMGWKFRKNKNPAITPEEQSLQSQKLQFKRENEQLEIEFLQKGEEKIVKFFISSAL